MVLMQDFCERGAQEKLSRAKRFSTSRSEGSSQGLSGCLLARGLEELRDQQDQQPTFSLYLPMRSGILKVMLSM